jgi:hypothetical protein
VATWPLIWPGEALIQRRFDGYGSVWILWSLGSSAPESLSTAHVDTQVFAFLGSLLARFLGPIKAFHLYSFLAIWASFVAAERAAAKAFEVSQPASFLAGVVYALGPLTGTAISEGHGGMLGPFLPLLLLALCASAQRPWRWAAVVSLAWFGCALQSGYFGVMGVLLVLGWCVLESRPWRPLLAVMLLPAGLFLALFSGDGLTATLATDPGGGALERIGQGATDLSSLAGMPEKEEWMRGYRRHGLLWTLFALGVVLPLGRSSRKDRGLALFALVAVILSLGPALRAHTGEPALISLPWWRVVEVHPALALFRFPDRMLWLYFLLAGVAAARSVEWLSRGRRGPGAVLLSLVLAETLLTGTRPTEARGTTAEIPSAYAVVTEGERVLDLWPAHGPHHSQAMDYRSISCFYQVGHGGDLLRPCVPDDLVTDAQRRLGNTVLSKLVESSASPGDGGALPVLRGAGVDLVALHADAFSGESGLRVQQGLDAILGAPLSSSRDGGEFVTIYRVEGGSDAPQEPADTSLESGLRVEALQELGPGRPPTAATTGIRRNQPLPPPSRGDFPWRLPLLTVLCGGAVIGLGRRQSRG